MITAIIGTAISSVLFANLSKIATEGNKGKMAKEVERINSIVITMIMPLFYLFYFSKVLFKFYLEEGNLVKSQLL